MYSKENTALHLAVRQGANKPYCQAVLHNFCKALEYKIQKIPEYERNNVQSSTYANFISTNLSSFTSAGIPPLLNIASNPCLWCDKLWSVPTAALVDSRSLLLEIARTKAATIWGLFIIACLEASFFDSWCTIMAACETTTWSSSFKSLMSSGIARVAKSASSWGKIMPILPYKTQDYHCSWNEHSLQRCYPNEVSKFICKSIYHLKHKQMF